MLANLINTTNCYQIPINLPRWAKLVCDESLFNSGLNSFKCKVFKFWLHSYIIAWLPSTYVVSEQQRQSVYCFITVLTYQSLSENGTWLWVVIDQVPNFNMAISSHFKIASLLHTVVIILWLKPIQRSTYQFVSACSDR